MAAGPTIYDIAKRAKVGIATVSRVINGSARVAEPTRQAVTKAMADLGFRPNRAARRLAAGGPNRARVVALLPFFSTNFYFSVAKPLSQSLAEADIDLVLCNVQTREDKNRILDRILRERSCEGLLICSMGVGPERIRQFEAAAIPIVMVDFPLADLPSVSVDNVAGGELAARALRDRGARRLGLLGGPQAAHAFRDREIGFHAVAGADAPVLRCDQVTPEEGRRAARQLLREHQVDGLVCVNDLLAVGALDEARDQGIAVPATVQIIGFDDQPLMDHIGLTTVRQPMERFGTWAATVMKAILIDRGDPPASERLPLTLVPRATTR